jgi:hypothetical protein
MAILYKPNEQTPARLQGPAHPALPGKIHWRRERSSRGGKKNQPFATIAQIRPWNPVDRAR